MGESHDQTGGIPGIRVVVVGMEDVPAAVLGRMIHESLDRVDASLLSGWWRKLGTEGVEGVVEVCCDVDAGAVKDRATG